MKIVIPKISFIILFFLLTATAVCADVNENAILTTDEIDSLIQDLGSPDTLVKADAAKTLVEIGDPAVEPLIEALRNEDYDIRENAVLVLGKIGNETAIDPLIEALSA